MPKRKKQKHPNLPAWTFEDIPEIYIYDHNTKKMERDILSDEREKALVDAIYGKREPDWEQRFDSAMNSNTLDRELDSIVERMELEESDGCSEDDMDDLEEYSPTHNVPSDKLVEGLAKYFYRGVAVCATCNNSTDYYCRHCTKSYCQDCLISSHKDIPHHLVSKSLENSPVDYTEFPGYYDDCSRNTMIRKVTFLDWFGCRNRNVSFPNSDAMGERIYELGYFPPNDFIKRRNITVTSITMLEDSRSLINSSPSLTPYAIMVALFERIHKPLNVSNYRNFLDSLYLYRQAKKKVAVQALVQKMKALILNQSKNIKEINSMSFNKVLSINIG